MLKRIAQRAVAFWIGFLFGAIVTGTVVTIAVFWIGTMFIRRLVG